MKRCRSGVIVHLHVLEQENAQGETLSVRGGTQRRCRQSARDAPSTGNGDQSDMVKQRRPQARRPETTAERFSSTCSSSAPARPNPLVRARRRALTRELSRRPAAPTPSALVCAASPANGVSRPCDG